MSSSIVQIYKNKSSAKPPAIHLPLGLQSHELIHPDLTKAAADLFSVNGVLTVHQLFPQPFIRQLYDAFCDRYHPYFDQQEYADALDVGDKRRMLTVDFQAPFNHPDLYGNPFLLDVMRSLLGDDFVLGSFGAVIALPGAKHQHIHRDHPPLFNDEAFDLKLPSFAITLVVPLVDLTAETGSTRVWKGSHRQSQTIKEDTADSFVPLMPTGSCYLMDYQLLHGGTPNQSDRVRPLLYIIYHRPWFQEAVNYEKQDRLAIALSEYKTIPEPYRFLFKQVRFNQIDQGKQSSLPIEQAGDNPKTVPFAAPIDSEGLNAAPVPSKHQPFAQLSAEQQIAQLTRIAHKALDQYGVNATDVELIHHGENTTFSVTTSATLPIDGHHGIYDPHRLALRISRANYLSIETIESELQWLHGLSRIFHIAVPIPMATAAGPFAAWVVAPEVLDEEAEGRVCALMQWVNGTPFDIGNPLDCDGMAKLAAAGNVLGCLHRCASNRAIPNGFSRPVWNWNGLFGEHAGYSNNGAAVWELVPRAYRSLFESVSHQTKAVMEALGEAPDQFGLIHGDFWQGNLLSRGGELSPIDFADCGWGYWGYDMARLLSDFAFSTASAPDLKLFLDRVLKGYEEGRFASNDNSLSTTPSLGQAFPSEQLPHIPLFIAAQQASFGLWCINRAQDHPVFRANLKKDLQFIANNIDVALNIPWDFR